MMFTPGNTIVAACLLLSAFGIICSSYTSSWCSNGASISTGFIGVFGAGVWVLRAPYASSLHAYSIYHDRTG